MNNSIKKLNFIKTLFAIRYTLVTNYYPLITKTGFTLIELLVATSILGMIALAIFSTFASGLNVYSRVQTYASVQADVLLSLEKMERDLRNTLNFAGINFTGEGKKISFPIIIKTVDTESNQNISSLGKISYYFDSETGALVKEEQNYPEVTSGIETEENGFEILAFIEDINFSYYYFDLETQEYGWKSSWSAGEGIPIGVKIEVTFKDGKKDVKLARTVFIPISG